MNDIEKRDVEYRKYWTARNKVGARMVRFSFYFGLGIPALVLAGVMVASWFGY